MKLKQGFITHLSGSEHILVSAEENGFSGLVRSNETAAFIIEQLKESTDRQQLVDALLNEYDVDAPRAEKAVDAVLLKLRSIGALDEEA